MSSTDERVVRMRFDNASFMKGAADTQKSLADLNKSVDAAGNTRGLTDLSGQMAEVGVSASKMQVVTVAALATIASKATAMGLSVIKGLALDPISSGFAEYEENLNKLNTIMNATGKSEKVVQGFLTDLNHYSDKTIYSFSNMTASIQKFVNAGVPLPKSVEAIKGIANAAAYSGATTEEANRAMFAFSQTMSTGFMMLNDWQQIDNANMGTVKFKQTLIDTAVAQGTLTKRGNEYITAAGKVVTSTKGWREGLQDQWATTEVVTASLAKYTDTQTALGKAATESAMEYRTFSAFFDSFKESLGSGWAAIFNSLIGGLDEATAFWTGLADAVMKVTGGFFNFLSVSLKTWRTMGGFEKTIQGFKNLLAPLGAIFHVIGAALQAAFPSGNKGVGKTLYAMSAGFEAITRPLQWFADVIEGTTPIVATFFKLLHIIGAAIKGAGGTVADFIKNLLDMVHIDAPSSSGLVGFVKDLAHAISDAINKVDELISKGASIGSAFGAIDFKMPSMPDVKMPSMPSMPSLPSFGGDGAAKGATVMSGSVGDLTGNLHRLQQASDAVGKSSMFKSETFSSAKESLGGVGDQAKDVASAVAGSGDKIKSAWQAVVDFVGPIKDKIVDFIKSISMDDVVSSFNMAFLMTMVVQVGKFLHSFSTMMDSFAQIGPGFMGTLAQIQTSLGDFSAAAKKEAQAKQIMAVAVALGVMAAAVFLLSTIPVEKLAVAMGGLTAIVLLLTFTMKQMAKMVEELDGKKTNLKMIAISIAMAALGFAMMELAVAMKIMDSVDIDGVVKGLVSMFVVMKLVQSMGTMAGTAAKNMISGAAAIAIISGSMVLLAAALLMFKLVDWGSMGKAGVALLGLTLAVGALAMIPYQGIAKVGLALLGASAGMIAIALALIMFKKVEWESIAKAGVVLLGLTLALAALMYVANPISVGMFLALGASMLYLSFALKNLNDVEWASIGKLALVFLVLIVAVLALTVALTALAPVIPVLFLFALALLALGAALVLFAAGMAIAMSLAAAGTAAFASLAIGAAVAVASFFQTLAHEAPLIKKAFLKILEEILDGMVKAVPMIINAVKRMWEAVKKEFTSSDKQKETGKAGQTWVSSAADGIKARMPEIVKKAGELIVSFLTSMRSKADDIAAAGVGVVVSVINGIARKVGDIANAAANLIVKFMEAIRAADHRILEAGVDLIAGFLHDLADTIRRGSSAIGAGITDVADAFKDVGVDMVQGMINGITGMLDDVQGAVTSVVGKLPGWARKLLGESSPSKVFYDIGKFLVQGLTNGIQDNAALAISATAAMITGQIALADDLMSNFIQKLDQRALAARGKASGLQAAAKKAQAAANKTKGRDNRADDQAANRISRQAKAADRAADKAEKKAKAEKAAAERQRKWEAADELERAKIRSADAERQLNASKQAEQDAEAARVQAAALMRQSRAKDVTAKQRAQFRRQAKQLRNQAKADAANANKQLENAKKSATDAMEWQQKAGKTAAESYQEQFDAQAKAAKDAEEFEKLSAAEKAKIKREEAEAKQKEADDNLKAAKQLAYSDVNAANELAQLAMDQAQQARDLLNEAIDFEAQGGSGQVLNLQPTDAAALAFNGYADTYSSAYAAAAARPTVEFNQYNTSPESLNADQIYRQSNNLLSYAAEKVSTPAA